MKWITAIKVMLMVVIFLLLMAAIPVDWRSAKRIDAEAARAQIGNFEQALTHYKLDSGDYPTTEQGLEALRTRPANVAHWDGPYLVKEIPLDPWGHRYVYKFPGEHGKQPDIISFGADGQPGGEGPNADIASWKN